MGFPTGCRVPPQDNNSPNAPHKIKKLADTNHDGNINYEEFVPAILSLLFSAQREHHTSMQASDVPDGLLPRATCDSCPNQYLDVDANWFHKPGSTEDLCAEAFHALPECEQEGWVFVASPEILGESLEKYLVHPLTNKSARLTEDYCMTCNAHAPFVVCSTCRVVRYCGSTCQAGHWPEHKRTCVEPSSVDSMCVARTIKPLPPMGEPIADLPQLLLMTRQRSWLDRQTTAGNRAPDIAMLLGIGGMVMRKQILQVIQAAGSQQLPGWCTEEIRSQTAKPSDNCEDQAAASSLLGFIVNAQCAEAEQLLLDTPEPARTALANVRNFSGEAALALAAKCGLASVVTSLITAGAALDSRAPRSGGTALHEACWANFSAVVEALVKGGANTTLRIVNGNRGLHGFTPMHLAARQNSVAAIFLLWQCSDNGRAALFTDCTPAGEPPFCIAAMQENVEALRLMHALGCDIHLKNPNGVSPLHNAVLNEHTCVVRTLIEIGYDINVKTAKNETALYIACVRGSARMVDLLVAAGCDTNVATETGGKSFHTAGEGNHLDLAAFLTNKCAQCSSKSACTKCRLQRKQAERRLARQQESHEATQRAAIKAEEREAEIAEIGLMEFPDFADELRRVEQELEEHNRTHRGGKGGSGGATGESKKSRRKGKKKKR